MGCIFLVFIRFIAPLFTKRHWRYRKGNGEKKCVALQLFSRSIWILIVLFYCRRREPLIPRLFIFFSERNLSARFRKNVEIRSFKASTPTMTMRCDKLENVTDSVYSAAFSCFFGICSKGKANRTLKINSSTFYAAIPHADKHFLVFLCPSHQITDEKNVEDMTRSHNLPSVWQHLNCNFCRRNSRKRPEGVFLCTCLKHPAHLKH
jgi:hypothetical protein